jgi:hypothetical protein
VSGSCCNPCNKTTTLPQQQQPLYCNKKHLLYCSKSSHCKSSHFTAAKASTLLQQKHPLYCNKSSHFTAAKASIIFESVWILLQPLQQKHPLYYQQSLYYLNHKATTLLAATTLLPASLGP